MTEQDKVPCGLPEGVAGSPEAEGAPLVVLRTGRRDAASVALRCSLERSSSCFAFLACRHGPPHHAQDVTALALDASHAVPGKRNLLEARLSGCPHVPTNEHAQFADRASLCRQAAG
jgi:hypothetical protein